MTIRFLLICAELLFYIAGTIVLIGVIVIVGSWLLYCMFLVIHEFNWLLPPIWGR